MTDVTVLATAGGRVPLPDGRVIDDKTPVTVAQDLFIARRLLHGDLVPVPPASAPKGKPADTGAVA